MVRTRAGLFIGTSFLLCLKIYIIVNYLNKFHNNNLYNFKLYHIKNSVAKCYSIHIIRKRCSSKLIKSNNECFMRAYNQSTNIISSVNSSVSLVNSILFVICFAFVLSIFLMLDLYSHSVTVQGMLSID